MNNDSLIRTLQDTIESQNKTIEGLREELKKANENMEYLIKKLYGRKTEKTSAIDGQLVISDMELGLFNEAEKEIDSSVPEPIPLFEIIKANSTIHSIDTMCKVLNYPRSTYYDKQKEKPDNMWKSKNKKLQQDILKIYNDSNKIYGAPKIREELKAIGYENISVKRVQRHMKKLGIRSIVVKKYRPHKTNKVYDKGENLLNRDFSTNNINEKWVADITYIHTLRDGWTYLASILDLHTQKIVGYSYSKTMDTSLVLKALDNAIVSQSPGKGLIIHSDRGSQYTLKEYRKAVESKEFRLSYSAKGCPYDNACIESFHAVLKKEYVYLHTFIDYKHAQMELFKYIEGFYNRKRIHSSINYMTPNEYEQICRAA